MAAESSNASFGAAASLAELEARFRRDCELLIIPPTTAWLEPKADPSHGPMLDVAIVGAGMAGLAVAMALKRLGITNFRLFDKSPAEREGPWLTYARMEVLRSPPDLTGPALGFANLTFRAWFEAQFGPEAWTKLYRIPRTQWMDYLNWYRKMVAAPIENDCEMTAIEASGNGVVMSLRTKAGERKVVARRVVLANGRDGLGGAYIPEIFRGLSKLCSAHSSDEIDFAKLQGRTVGVIGAGASAVDNAAEALEAGASHVAMLVRRPDVPRVNRGMGIGSAGMWAGFQNLPPERRWAVIQVIADSAIPPPHISMLRCTRHKNFAVVTRCEPSSAREEDGRVKLKSSRGNLAFDFLVLATGFEVDWPKRPELAGLRRDIVVWSDRFTPPGGRALDQGEYPWLGPALEFTAREPGRGAWVERVHCYTYPAILSHGPVSGDIPAISVGAERIANGIASSLFCEDYEQNWQKFLAFNTPELTGEEYTPATDISAFLDT